MSRELDRLIAVHLFDRQGVGYYGPTKPQTRHTEYALMSWEDARAAHAQHWGDDHDVLDDPDFPELCYWEADYGPRFVDEFSSGWRGMQLVVDVMTQRGWAVMIESNASGFLMPWTCLFASRIGRKSAIGTSAPEAVARAALAALGVPLPQETTP